MTGFFRSGANGAAVGTVLVWLAATPAAAGDLEDLAGAAARAVSAGKTLEALDDAAKFSQAVWDAAPLAFRKTELVETEPAAFGAETPRADNVYRADEEILIYAEPVAFGWRETDDGVESDMTADVRVATADGKIIIGMKGFSDFKIAAGSRDTDIFVTLAYTFGGLKPGDYVVTTTLNDTVSGKAGAFSLPVTIK